MCVIITHRLLGRECEQVLQQSQHYVTHLKWPAISSAYPHTCFPVPHTHTHLLRRSLSHSESGVSLATPSSCTVGRNENKENSSASRLAINASSKVMYSPLDPLLPVGVSGCVYVCERMTAGVRVQRPAVLIKLIIAIMLLFPELV